MRHCTLFSSTALVLCLSAGASLAVTPEEVWANWKAVLDQSGVTLTAQAETRNGAALEVTGLSLRNAPADGGSVAVSLDRMIFTDQGDGSVRITASDSYFITVLERDASAEKPSARIEVTAAGTQIIASGTAEAVAYDVLAPKTVLTLREAHKRDGSPVEARFVAEIADVKGNYLVAPKANGASEITSSASGGLISFNGSGEKLGAEAQDRFTVNGTVAGFNTANAGTLLEAAQMENLAAAMRAGFAVKSTGSLGKTDVNFSLTEKGKPSSGALSFAGIDLNTTLDQERMDYGFKFAPSSINITAADTGLAAIQAAFDEMSFGFAMPVAQGEAAKDFSYLTRVSNLTLSETIWALFDPSKTLPRDPLNLVVDLSGKAAWLQDIFAMATAAPPSDKMPMRLDALTINEISAKAIGSEVKAQGDLTFDNSDLQTFDGFPAPTGKVTVDLAGVGSLLEKMVAMGVIPADQLTSVRMGLAMFTRAGAAADSLVSEIEFKDKGLFVNGQRIM